MFRQLCSSLSGRGFTCCGINSFHFLCCYNSDKDIFRLLANIKCCIMFIFLIVKSYTKRGRVREGGRRGERGKVRGGKKMEGKER